MTRPLLPASAIIPQPDEYRTRPGGRWIPFPARYFSVPRSLVTGSKRFAKWTSIEGHWPGSRLQIAALSWSDGRVWTAQSGFLPTRGSQ